MLPAVQILQSWHLEVSELESTKRKPHRSKTMYHYFIFMDELRKTTSQATYA
jgi:hypothetical protein